MFAEDVCFGASEADERSRNQRRSLVQFSALTLAPSMGAKFV